MSLQFPGLVVPFRYYHLLVFGAEAEALGEPLFGPPVFLRPGYRFFAENNYLLPTEVVDDVGQHFLPPQAYDWIEQRGDVFPRSDALGVLPSGEKKSVFLKELDLAVMAAFASAYADPGRGTHIRLDLAIEAEPVPDGYALVPADFPISLLARALPCYRLSPGVFGAVGAGILNQILASKRTGWKLRFDDVDDALGA